MISADHLRRLTALNVSAEALQVFLSILAELQGADDARREREDAERERERVRRAKYPRQPRGRHKDGHSDATVTELGRGRDGHSDGPPSDSLKKERKNPETIEVSGPAGPTQAELEKALYARGRQVLGKASGGLIATLLKTKQYDVALARAVIETSSTKHDPREYVGAAIRSKANDPKSAIAAADRLIDRLGGVEAANGYVPGSSGPAPLRLDFGQVPTGPKLISQG